MNEPLQTPVKISQLPQGRDLRPNDLLVSVQDGSTVMIKGSNVQQVLIGEPAVVPTFPAIAFVPRVISGQTVYEMRVSA